MNGPVQPRPEALLPHGAAARFVVDIVRVESRFLIATASVPGTHPLARANQVPCFLGLEIGAQAAAVLEGLVRRTEAGDRARRIGYLVGVRTAAFSQSTLPVDTVLTVSARLTGAAPPLAVYHVTVAIAGRECLAATLSTHVGAD